MRETRPFDPVSHITFATGGRVRELPINPSDVLPIATFMGVLGIEDPQLVNHWFNRHVDNIPPFEEMGVWKSGRGGARVIRKDRLLHWVETGGESVSCRACWPQAARILGTVSRETTQELLSRMFADGGLTPALRPTKRKTLDKLYY